MLRNRIKKSTLKREKGEDDSNKGKTKKLGATRERRKKAAKSAVNPDAPALRIGRQRPASNKVTTRGENSTLKKSRSGRLLRKMSRKKKKQFRAPSVSFTIDSSYSLDESIASCLSGNTPQKRGTQREVVTQKRVTFTAEELDKFARISHSSLKSERYDGVDDAIYDKRAVDNNMDNESVEEVDEEEEPPPSPSPSFYDRDSFTKKVANLDDVFMTEVNTDLEGGDMKDSDLEFVHNNRKTKLDI